MEKIRQLFTNPELRKRLIFTLVMLVIYRLGVHVSVPGVNAEALAKNLGKAGDLLNVVDLFSGGAFKKFSIFALGITPYITASIVLQLMGAVVPTLENLQKKEGEAGPRQDQPVDPLPHRGPGLHPGLRHRLPGPEPGPGRGHHPRHRLQAAVRLHPVHRQPSSSCGSASRSPTGASATASPC